jgi:hypothetical protein
VAAGTQPAVRPKGMRDPLDERVRRRTASLDPIFNPGSVVVIADGVDPKPAASTILSTISKSGFAGKLFAWNKTLRPDRPCWSQRCTPWEYALLRNT